MAWTRVQQSVLAEGKEKQDPNSPGVSNAIAAHRGLNPCVVRSKKTGNLIAFYSRGIAHGAVGSVGCRRASTDEGRTWGDTALDETVVLNYNILWQNSIQSAMTHSSGRIILAGFADDANNTLGTPGTTARAFLGYTDDDGLTATWFTLPQVDDYIHCTGLAELPGGRVLVTFYTRRSGKSGARSYCWFSDDRGASAGAFTTGGLGVIASDPNYTTEYKEPTIVCMDNGTLLSLIRSDDSTQKIYSSFSTDGGPTWSATSVAFNAWNIPSVIQTSDGTIVCTSRHHTGVPSDGTDYSEMFTSPDRGSSWSAGTALYDPVLGVGASAGCSAVEMLDPGRLGVLHAWAPPASVYNLSRLEFITLTQSPRTSGEFTRTDLNVNDVHPSRDLTDGSGNSTVFAFLAAEDLRQNDRDGAAVPRWTNLMGDPHWDFVPGTSGSGGPVFHDGSAMITPPGCLGGRGELTGAGTLVAASPVPLAQPLALFFVGDATTPISQLTLWDDGQGTGLFFQSSNGQLFVRTNLVNQFFQPAGWPPGRVVLTMLLNGAGTSLRCNGVALSNVSGGPLSGATTAKHIRLGGAGGANFWAGLRWFVGAQLSDLTKIAAYEAKLVAKHRING